jgi:hypothetical protein
LTSKVIKKHPMKRGFSFKSSLVYGYLIHEKRDSQNYFN